MSKAEPENEIDLKRAAQVLAQIIIRMVSPPEEVRP